MTFRFVMGKEQVVRPNTCKINYDYYSYDDDGDICHLNVCNPEWLQRQSCLNRQVQKRREL